MSRTPEHAAEILDRARIENWWVIKLLATSIDWNLMTANASTLFLGCGPKASELACMRLLLMATKRVGKIYGVDVDPLSNNGSLRMQCASAQFLQHDYVKTPGKIMHQVARPIGAIIARNPNIFVQEPGKPIVAHFPELVEGLVEWAKIALDFQTQLIVTTEHSLTNLALKRALHDANIPFEHTSNSLFRNPDDPGLRERFNSNPVLLAAVRANLLPDQYVIRVKPPLDR